METKILTKQIIAHTGYAVLLLNLILRTIDASAAVNLSSKDHDELLEMGDSLVFVALQHAPHADERLMREFGFQGYSFSFIDTVLTRLQANKALALAEHDLVLDLEIIDDSMAAVIRDLLIQVFRIALYDDLNLFDVSVLNISIGPPKHLLNRNRTADRSIRRAYTKIVKNHGIPVVTSAGNDGPVLGLLNPWTLADGVIVVGATDVEGKRLWTRSSRAALNSDVEGMPFFVAHGENTIGALASGLSKTEEMLQAEKQVDMVAAVGTENVDRYTVRSGTSFAAASVSRLLCYPQQMVMLLRGYASAMESIDNYQMKPYVRGYIDTGIDQTHPVFQNRLVDKRHYFGGLQLKIDQTRKQRFFQFFASNAIDVSIRYSPDFVFQFLKAIARPVPGTTANQIGYGFVSEMAAATYLREAQYSTLIQLFAPHDDSRRSTWLRMAGEAGDPRLFSEHETAKLTEYCRNFDLVLALPLHQ